MLSQASTNPRETLLGRSALASSTQQWSQISEKRGSTSRRNLDRDLVLLDSIDSALQAEHGDRDRALRYARKSTLQALIPWRLKEKRWKGETRYFHEPIYRSGSCGRMPVPGAGFIKISRPKMPKLTAAPDNPFAMVATNPPPRTAQFHDVLRCKSPHCPICNYLTTELDRARLYVRYKAGLERGASIFLATYTASHHREDRVSDFAARMRRAKKWMYSGRAWSMLAAQLGYVGADVGWDYTYWENGHHFHFNDLLYFDHKLTNDEFHQLQAFLDARWHTACARFGLVADTEHGFRLDYSSLRTAAYVAKYGREPKWDVDKEMTLHSAKRGAGDHLTFFQLIDRIAAQHSPRDIAAVQEYLAEFRGARARKLYLSRKVTAWLTVPMPTMDDVRAGLGCAEREIFAAISKDVWELMHRAPKRGDVYFRLDHAAAAAQQLIRFHRVCDAGSVLDVQKWVRGFAAQLPAHLRARLSDSDLNVGYTVIDFSQVMNSPPGDLALVEGVPT